MSDFNVSKVVNNPFTYIGTFAVAGLLNLGAAVIENNSKNDLILTEVREIGKQTRENGRQIAELNTRVAVLDERIVRLHPEIGSL